MRSKLGEDCRQVSDAALPSKTYACLGFPSLGQCDYNPASPPNIYFSLGELVGALAFTLAVQQLLKPIYQFRLSARYLSLKYLYWLVFAGVGASLIAATVPHVPILHTGPWGYAVLWEVLAFALFVTAYGAMVIAMVVPIRVRATRIPDFARGAANLLSAANEIDHVDVISDLRHSISTLMHAASFHQSRGETTAFFDFAHRREIERRTYAASLLQIVADPSFCKTLVTKAPWHVAVMLREISTKELHVVAAKRFIEELGHQAIMRDESMLTREVGYHGFGTSPLLSDSLFSNPFIVTEYNPIQQFSYKSGDDITVDLLKRFNSAAERCYTALIDSKIFYRAQTPNSIQSFYNSVFMRAYKLQQQGDTYESKLSLEMGEAIRLARRMAYRLLCAAPPNSYQHHFVSSPKDYKYDILETLVNIVYEALEGISNNFRGFDDPFWIMAMHDIMHKIYNSVGEEPDGMTPFQQRLTLKIIKKMNENMEGFYPAICRVMLATVGPYDDPPRQPNLTAFNILKDAVYIALRRFPALATAKPDKVKDYLPPNVIYNPATATLIHTFRGGEMRTTRLLALDLKPMSLTGPWVRRELRGDERRACTEGWH